jgi:UDP-sugar pyrophosphorylase
MILDHHWWPAVALAGGSALIHAGGRELAKHLSLKTGGVTVGSQSESLVIIVPFVIMIVLGLAAVAVNFRLLLNASASSFTAPSNYQSKSLKTSSSSPTRLPFMYRTGKELKSEVPVSVECPSQSVVSSANLDLLSERGRKTVLSLIENDVNGSQIHVYGDWPEDGVQDDDKFRLSEQVRKLLRTYFWYQIDRFIPCFPPFQLADLDNSYPGGLTAYLLKARTLLKESADRVNPFAEYEADVPAGESLSFDGEGTMPFLDAEQLGIQGMSGVVFVLVAGGLGERLGYSGIKLSLETNLCTNECYLEVYVRYIKAMQYLAKLKTGNDDIRIPLVIMTSGDTDPLTRQLLKDNNNFGMDDDMISIVMQDKVAALKDGNAGLALEDDDRWAVQTKPHGHGDVHHLLYREGLVDKWEKEGRTHVVFLQDTNTSFINSVVPTLGVSIAKGFHMNSICIPRLAGEAAGAIARLECVLILKIV